MANNYTTRMAAEIENLNIDDLPPSAVVVGEHWLSSTLRVARGWPGSRKRLGRSGKWLIYPSGGDHQLDECWETIRVATEGDLLGYKSIASTAHHIRIGEWPYGVIMVFTYDYKDKEDVRRVRDALRKLGFTEILSYKTDEDTAAGISRANGHERIALYQA